MRRRLAADGGFSLVEMLVVLSILGFIMAGLAYVIVSGGRAQTNTSARVDAQQGTRLAVDRLEYEARCATAATSLNAGAGVALTLPAQCGHATGNVAWCVTSGVLTRYAGSACSGQGTPYVTSVTTPTPFSLSWSGNNLPKLAVHLSVNDGGVGSDAFTLNDTISLRNGLVSIGAPSPATGAVASNSTITGVYFMPSTALTVTVGATAATIVSGGTTSSTGAVNVTFKIPFTGNGSFDVIVSDGVHTTTSATKFVVTGSFDGLGLTSQISNPGGHSPTCGAITKTTFCSGSGVGAAGSFSGKPTLENTVPQTKTNTGAAAITVTCTVQNEISPGGTGAPASSTIAVSAFATASAFTLTGAGAGWQALMTCSATINGVAYSVLLQGAV